MRTSIFMITIFFIQIQLFCYTCSGNQAVQKPTNQEPIRIYPKILSVISHDTSAFTQGFFYKNGKLYESTGLNNQSSLRVLDTTGKMLKKIDVPQVFAEGCTFFKDNIYQLTWKNEFAIIYSFPDLTSKGTISYQGEGWGLTSNNTFLIMSNGSDTLYFMNSNFETEKELAIVSNGTPLTNLNELEYARNRIYANVWFSDYIFEISPQSGTVSKIIDCSQIIAHEKPKSNDSVLNGIAFVPSLDLFYITGKNWKNIYLISLD